MHSDNHRPFDGYIRVSQVAGREGESFISPDVQRETIERLAALNGLTLDEVIEETDVSGGKKVRDRELGRLVEKVETGMSGGVIVWKLTRFSRNMLDSVETVTKITGAGGRLLAGDFDSSGPMGKALLGLLSGLAEEELDARRENWRAAKTRAVGRGVHVSANVPFGYVRPWSEPNPKTGKRSALPLERDPNTDWAVQELFRRRAAGATWEQLRQWLVGNDLPTVKGAPWCSSTLMGLVKNRVYLGEARGAGGDHVAEGAHPAIVDEPTWYAAQSRHQARHGHGNENPALLIGLVRCGACRYVMQARPSTGSRGAVYVCNSRVGCPNPAVITGHSLNGSSGVDEYVLHMARGWEQVAQEQILFGGYDPALAIDADEAELEQLSRGREEDRLDDDLKAALGRQEWLKHLADLTARIDEKQATITTKKQELGKPVKAGFWDKWDEGEISLEEMRDHLAASIQAVFVNPTTKRRSRFADPELRRRWFLNRIAVVRAIDEPLTDIPRHGRSGYRIQPWPFPTNPHPDEVGVVPLQPEVEDAGEPVV